MLAHQLHKGVTRIGITVAVNRLRLRNQHLRHNLPIVGKKLLICVHQNALTNSSSSLLAGNRRRLAGQAHAVNAHSHSAARNKNHLLALILQIADFSRQTVNLTEVALAVGIGNRARANLNNNALGIFQGLTIFFSF